MNTPISPKLDKLLLDMGIDMPVSPTVADVVMWLYEKHEIWTYVHKDGGWWFPVIENYYDEDDQGTIIEDLSKMTKTYFDSLTEAYEAAITYTLTNLI